MSNEAESNSGVGFVAGHDKLQVPDSHVSFSACERDVLAYWEKIDAFKTSLKLSEGRKPYSFYDGPPFATGLPHYGHILAGTIKDTVTRFAHQTGHYVPRRFGWDCHGLPVEYEIDKAFNIKSKDDVLKMGIATYNEECRSIVTRYVNEWKTTVNRVGRWIDFDNAYKTMDLTFMESVWWVFKTIYDKGLVYRGFKVMPYSTTCTTPISNFEANLNYQMVKDPSVVVSFPVIDEPNTHFVAWTTTPWTLPSNLALCVNPNLTYIKLLDIASNKIFYLCKSRIEQLYPSKKKGGNKEDLSKLDKAEIQRRKEEALNNIPLETEQYKILDQFPGQSLVNKKYVPLFTYFADQWKNTAFRVISDDYVTDDSGTGIVHCAPAFGEDDNRVCLLNGITEKGGDILCPVDESGRLTSEVKDFAGRYVKEADGDIIRFLKKNDRVISQAQYEHSYPYCWRSDTPLIYKAVPSWFVSVESFKDKIINSNEQTKWVPQNVSDGRFTNWLKDARDWAISRSRYWGTPIPIWMSADGKSIVVIGSVKELEELSGVKNITDIHKHKIDHITIPDPRGSEYPPLKRIEDVFDCWFESGSMPYAQQHYPFENKEIFEETFPADFIGEGLDQTRGWFYTLMILSTALFGKAPFKNVIVNGMINASDGKKMSKRLKNYPDPVEILEKYGADSLRLYLITSPAVRAESINFKEDGILQTVKRVILPWWNAFRFGIENVIRYNDNGKNFILDMNFITKVTNVMDKWIIAEIQTLIEYVKIEMSNYRLYTVVPALLKVIDQLTNWYVRTNRNRFKGTRVSNEDNLNALSTLIYVLLTLCKLMAPFTPFLVETMYQHLKLIAPMEDRVDSIHYLLIPEPINECKDEKIEQAVHRLQRVVELGRAGRENRNVSLKQPIKSVKIVCNDNDFINDIKNLEDYIKEELNVRNVEYDTKVSNYVNTTIAPNPRILGSKLGSKLPLVIKELSTYTTEQIDAIREKGSVTVLDNIVLNFDELNVTISNVNSNEGTEIVSDSGVVVLLDVSPDKTLQMEGIAREIVNRVQQLRKSCNLLPHDKIEVYYNLPDFNEYKKKKNAENILNLPIPEFALDHNSAVIAARKAAGLPETTGNTIFNEVEKLSKQLEKVDINKTENNTDNNNAKNVKGKKEKNPPKNKPADNKVDASNEEVILLSEVINNCSDIIKRSLNCKLIPSNYLPTYAHVYGSEQSEVSSQPIVITLAKRAAIVLPNKDESADFNAGVSNIVGSTSYDLFYEAAVNNKTDGPFFNFIVNGKNVKLEVNKNLFFSVESAIDAGYKL